MLELHGLSVTYGKHRALDGVSLYTKPGEIVVILGANGAGKSTVLKSIAGICEGRVTGAMSMNGEGLLGLPPHKVVERGVALVPEGRGVFADLSVRENLMLGANPERAREDAQANYDRLIGLFPKLAERAGQTVRTMSGGEQQMVAIGRAMMSNPTILMLDEPSLGLSPLLSRELFQNLKAVREAGLGILLVEQNARLSLGIADRGYLLENGEILREERADVLRSDPAVQAAYLGGGGAKSTPAQTAKPAASVTPPAVTVRQKTATTQSASQVSGLDITALVSRAAQQSLPARDMRPTTAHTTTTPARTRHDRATPDPLRKLLAEMEDAARAAHMPATDTPLTMPALRPASRLSTMKPRTTPEDARPAANQPAQVAPTPGGKVEIYRRRPGSTQFDRTER
ncbi:ABC transporter ATP-binding protein [Roseinatronobacter alkalisoli]|uniref:ABC transporter ATP-binding protein n=1 Tax=Roseinatronobacter alkalisoli TaxID=3028235 RepID=A0ABT5TA95_9RHOB|nr:ABC transporter ATP-binding protein [Roseinatronobacter sp. HJB301]MDD7972045.1 ABC transporter ATP-binding protein [Roseinatronobacter sp. HJB301]